MTTITSARTMHRSRVSRGVLLVAVVGASAGLAACSNDDDDDASPTTTGSDNTAVVVTNEPGATAPTSTDGTVTIQDFTFVAQGPFTADTDILVANEDSAAHTFTDLGGAFSVSLAAGSTGSISVAAGTYQVICEIHADMEATLTVE